MRSCPVYLNVLTLLICKKSLCSWMKPRVCISSCNIVLLVRQADARKRCWGIPGNYCSNFMLLNIPKVNPQKSHSKNEKVLTFVVVIESGSVSYHRWAFPTSRLPNLYVRHCIPLCNWPESNTSLIFDLAHSIKYRLLPVNRLNFSEL